MHKAHLHQPHSKLSLAVMVSAPVLIVVGGVAYFRGYNTLTAVCIGYVFCVVMFMLLRDDGRPLDPPPLLAGQYGAGLLGKFRRMVRRLAAPRLRIPVLILAACCITAGVATYLQVTNVRDASLRLCCILWLYLYWRMSHRSVRSGMRTIAVCTITMLVAQYFQVFWLCYSAYGIGLIAVVFGSGFETVYRRASERELRQRRARARAALGTRSAT